MTKKVVLLIISIGFLYTAGLAAEAVVKKNTAAFSHKPKTEYLLSGRVESITLADPSRGIKPSITLIAEDGSQITFLVRENTTIYDADLKAIKIDGIKKNSPGSSSDTARTMTASWKPCPSPN